MPRGHYPRNQKDDPRDEEMRKMQAQLEGLTLLVQRVLSSDDRPAAISQAEVEKKAPPLESVTDERKRFEAAWAAEERVTIMLSPTQDDVSIRDDARARLKNPNLDYLPRVHQINGIQLAIPVGQMYSVPLSIAAKIAYEQNPWQARGITPPVTFDQAEARMGLVA